MSAVPATVLVVEAGSGLRRGLQRALTRQGYWVLAAGSAETAYELLGSEHADAVLLDVRLPVMSGLALYLALLHRSPSLAGRMAIMTGDAEGDGVRTWLERNPCTVLPKPFDLHAILSWVKSVVDLAG